MIKPEELNIVECYVELLGREPSKDEFFAWKRHQFSGQLSEEEVRHLFVASDEFGQRLGYEGSIDDVSPEDIVVLTAQARELNDWPEWMNRASAIGWFVMRGMDKKPLMASSGWARIPDDERSIRVDVFTDPYEGSEW